MSPPLSIDYPFLRDFDIPDQFIPAACAFADFHPFLNDPNLVAFSDVENELVEIANHHATTLRKMSRYKPSFDDDSDSFPGVAMLTIVEHTKELARSNSPYSKASFRWWPFPAALKQLKDEDYRPFPFGYSLEDCLLNFFSSKLPNTPPHPSGTVDLEDSDEASSPPKVSAPPKSRTAPPVAVEPVPRPASPPKTVSSVPVSKPPQASSSKATASTDPSKPFLGPASKSPRRPLAVMTASKAPRSPRSDNEVVEEEESSSEDQKITPIPPPVPYDPSSQSRKSAPKSVVAVNTVPKPKPPDTAGTKASRRRKEPSEKPEDRGPEPAVPLMAASPAQPLLSPYFGFMSTSQAFQGAGHGSRSRKPRPSAAAASDAEMNDGNEIEMGGQSLTGGLPPVLPTGPTKMVGRRSTLASVRKADLPKTRPSSSSAKRKSVPQAAGKGKAAASAKTVRLPAKPVVVVPRSRTSSISYRSSQVDEEGEEEVVEDEYSTSNMEVDELDASGDDDDQYVSHQPATRASRHRPGRGSSRPSTSKAANPKASQASSSKRKLDEVSPPPSFPTTRSRSAKGRKTSRLPAADQGAQSAEEEEAEGEDEEEPPQKKARQSSQGTSFAAPGPLSRRRNVQAQSRSKSRPVFSPPPSPPHTPADIQSKPLSGLLSNNHN
ncbi:hypothetical protein PQX77_020325, partial [Marasmius sp. AFHP31]